MAHVYLLLASTLRHYLSCLSRTVLIIINDSCRRGSTDECEIIDSPAAFPRFHAVFYSCLALDARARGIRISYEIIEARVITRRMTGTLGIILSDVSSNLRYDK